MNWRSADCGNAARKSGVRGGPRRGAFVVCRSNVTTPRLLRALRRSALRALFVGTATALGAQAPAAVRVYEPGIHVAHYVFHVTIPDSGRHIALTSVAYLRRTSAVDSVWFDLESTMKVTRVMVNATDAKFVRDAHSVRVALPKWNPVCAAADRPRGDGPDSCVDWVSVDAAGEPTDGLIISQDPKGRWQYFCDHWPNRAHQWLPVIDHPSDKATVEWRVHAPSALRVVANGALLEESPIPNEPGRTLTAWRTEKPIPPYLMVIAAAPMARVAVGLSGGATACGLADGGGCVQQDVYEAPELAPVTPPGFASAPAIVEWLSRFVAPFPYEKLAHLESSTRFGGMENASAIFYADRSFRQMTLGEGTIAHETAHQWFGDAVTEGRWADLWLSEGFATYFAALWMAQPRAALGAAHGDSAFRAVLAGMRQTVLRNDVVAERPVIDTTQTDLLALLNRNSYEKGGFVLHMLRQQVGDSVWIRGIRRYYTAHKHGNALTGDLRAAVEQESKTDLKWFFDQWLTRPGFAELAVHWTFANGAVSLQITQSAHFGAYRLRLPVDVQDASGVHTRVVVDVPAQHESTVALPGRYTTSPGRLTFDPDGDLLATIATK